MRILFLSAWYPYPPDNGSRIRIYHLIKHLATRHETELLSFTDDEVSADRLAAMRELCRRVETAPARTFERGIQALPALLSSRPRSVVRTDSPQMRRLVREAARREPFDVIIASQISMAPYALEITGVPRLLEEIELASIFDWYLESRQPLARLRRRLTWQKFAGYVAGMAHNFDGYTTVSRREAQLFEGVMGGLCSAAVIPNGVDIRSHDLQTEAPAPDTLVYAGALTYSANFDAMAYFLSEILPGVQRARPEVRLTITGRVSGVPLDRLPLNDAVCLTGYLDDIRPTIARNWLSVVPLRQGGGTRLKVLESLALGTPVVSTGKGAEGLNLVPGQDLLIADDPTDFAQAVVDVLRQPELRAQLSRQGRRAVAGQYDWQSIGQGFEDYVQRSIRDAAGERHLSRTAQ